MRKGEGLQMQKVSMVGESRGGGGHGAKVVTWHGWGGMV